MNRLLIMFLVILLLLSCTKISHNYSNNTLGILSNTIKKTGDYISSNFLRYYGPKDLDDLKQKDLNLAFNNFLKLHEKVNVEYRSIMEVKQFIIQYINISNSIRVSSDSTISTAKDILTITGLDLNFIDDSLYLKKWCR